MINLGGSSCDGKIPNQPNLDGSSCDGKIPNQPNLDGRSCDGKIPDMPNLGGSSCDGEDRDPALLLLPFLSILAAKQFIKINQDRSSTVLIFCAVVSESYFF